MPGGRSHAAPFGAMSRVYVLTGSVPRTDVDQHSWFASYVDAMYAQGARANLGTATLSPNLPIDREDEAAVEAVVTADYMADFTDGSFQSPGLKRRAQAAKIPALLIEQEAP